ncbi:hypothetical protein SAMN05421839_10610 [Halolactibacillus halophilus]|uniref:Phage gp6-like head-tail connector protein n=1 Tax=Halolactibacillus halophilus TaxID=306540 RepID=A0A1I5MLI7_9BACI|nr:hypothetical protein [Halolactibacillus halophilus]GEM02501.1 hypothetical protein HHA03_20330 [Halolactibacillus halophilus]SFP10409.1 hypothetical protein SAMN05421839_10610 [Halolactibacillus halophilus]
METQALPLLKARLGITTNVRDAYLIAILTGIKSELTDIQGLLLDSESTAHLMFLVDYAEYRYSNKESPTMPRHLQWRLHNLLISNGGD